MFEGIADTGLKMLGQDQDDDDDRVQALLGRWRAGIVTQAAWKLHAEGIVEAAVRDWLAQRCLVGGEGWVDGRMKFVGSPARCAAQNSRQILTRIPTVVQCSYTCASVEFVLSARVEFLLPARFYTLDSSHPCVWFICCSAVLIWSYWHGEPIVTKAWERVAIRDRSAFLKFLYSRMHSEKSLSLFEPPARM